MGSKINVVLAVLGVTLMVAFNTFWMNKLGKIWNPLLIFTGGVLFFTSAWMLIRKPSVAKTVDTKWTKQKSIILFFVVFGLGVFWNVTDLQQIFQAYPIDAKMSDVIPSLEMYVQRWLAGEYVYRILPFDGYVIHPTYLPIMWMPYAIPETFGFDYRWMAYGSFMCMYAFIIINTMYTNESWYNALFKAALIPIVVACYCSDDSAVFGHAVELMPTTFYIGLLWAIFRKKLIWIGIFLGCCTLSRYAYSLWVIPFAFVIFSSLTFKDIAKIAGAGILFLLVVYIVPFFMDDPTILTRGLKNYSKVIEANWSPEFWQSPEEEPYHLGKALSFSYWFYVFIDGDPSEKLSVARNFQLILLLVTSILMCVVYWRKKHTIEWNIYLVYTLPVFIFLFYMFIYINFSYLYMLPVFLILTTFTLLFLSKFNNQTVSNDG